MHSFQPSRGRIFIEFLCALAIVASMVGAWRQTQASALLVAAGAAALLGMIRLFDMSRRPPAVAEEPQRIKFEPEARVEARVVPEVDESSAIEPVPAAERSGEVVEFAEPESPRSSAGRRKGGSRKGSGRRATASKQTKAVEQAAAMEVAGPAITAVDEPEIAAVSTAGEPRFTPAEATPEPVHVPHAPLFEPEPFVRMPRQAFGRRGRL